MQPFTIKAVETVKGVRNVIFAWLSKKDFDKSEYNVPRVTDFVDVIDDLTVLVKKLPITIGRGLYDRPNLSINNLHGRVSRTHAQIFEYNGVIKVRDLKSKFGTFILRPNEKPLRVTETGIKLKNNDRILLGSDVQLSILFEKPGIVKRFLGRIFG